MIQFSVVLMVLLAAVAWAIRIAGRRGRHRALTATAIRWTAFGFVAASTLLIGLFIVGDTFSDPGGVKAVWLTALWLLPLVGLSLATWFWPSFAAPVLVGASALVVAANVWFLVSSRWWRDVENAHGPMRAIAIFALGAALGVLGLHRPRLAGILLLTVSLAPAVLVAASGQRAGTGSLSIMATPAVIAGALFLWADSRQRRDASLASGAAPGAEG